MTDAPDVIVKAEDAVPPWEEKWLEYGRDLLKDAPTVLNEAAKYIISLVTIVIGIYTGGLTFLGIANKTGWFPLDISLILPIVIWLLSIGVCVNAYSPDLASFKPDSISDIRSKFEAISKHKYKQLRIGVYLFLLGLFVAAALLFIGPGVVPKVDNPAHPTVQFIVGNDSAQRLLDEMHIYAENGSHKTIPVILLNSSDSVYKVKLSNNITAEFNKNMADGILYIN
jgi:hypothetical protein